MSVLFTPIRIKNVVCPSRVAMPPMVRGVGPMPREVVETEGEVTEAVVNHYHRRAVAGTGLVIVEATAVDAEGRAWRHGLNAFADRHTVGLARLAEGIRSGGAVAGIQLVHAGPQGSTQVTGVRTVGPSAVAPSVGRPAPRALEIDEIHTIEGRFADAAERAVEAGFQVIEVHGAHGFLLDSFLMQARNQREDAYGGSLAGRMRFLLETCQAVRERIGDTAVLDCRISIFNKSSDFGPDELAELVEGLEGTGLDLLHVSTDGAFKGAFGTDRSMGQSVKQLTDLPIIVAGGLVEPAEAERLVAEEHADLAAVGRAMLKDPEWARHAREALGAAT
jgi:2,4-dienoyl-CoA reductase-like NADH-dependent reductase (Old Yellow Enzyme family)